MRAFVATKNADKLRELRALFAGSELELATYPYYIQVEESAQDYAGNALLKARGLHRQLDDVRWISRATMRSARDVATLADDSGIDVDALGGRPGVLSARYGGKISWPERLKLLLSELDGVPEGSRGARFVCAIALVHPDGRVVEAKGEVRGSIAHEPIGPNGFGYDPIFYYPPLRKTFGEISEAQKNRLSHRYHAAQALLAALRAR